MFDKLLNIHASNHHTDWRGYDAATLGNEQTQKGYDQKVPVFTVPKFVGNIL